MGGICQKCFYRRGSHIISQMSLAQIHSQRDKCGGKEEEEEKGVDFSD